MARDIVGSGQRVAQANDPTGPNVTRIAEDYDTYYVLSTLTADPVRNSFTRSNASFAAKQNVTTQTIDGFVTGDDAVPATGAAATAAAVAALAANPLATVRVEGFTDDVGAGANNLDLSGRRALSAAQDLVAAGVDGGRIQQVSRGATGFAVPNNSEANRARNRRVVLNVTRPAP